jgi:hypothetical protein
LIGCLRFEPRHRFQSLAFATAHIQQDGSSVNAVPCRREVIDLGPFGRSDLGSRRALRLAELPYDPPETTVDSQSVTLKTMGADVFFNESSPKFAAQAIRKAASANHGSGPQAVRR